MPSYTTDFSIVFRYLDVLLKGLKLTVSFTLVSTIGGLLIGLLLGGARLSRRPYLRGPAGVYIEVFRTTPLLVQLIWFYYALPMLIHVNISAPFAGGLALSLYVSSFYAEIFRGGIQSIERGQWDAAKALGASNASHLRLSPRRRKARRTRAAVPPAGTRRTQSHSSPPTGPRPSSRPPASARDGDSAGSGTVRVS